MLTRSARRVVVLTGAGISAESGIRTFRAADGLWEDHRVEDVATPEGFLRDPDLVHRFYNARRSQLLEVRPNAAHEALARFENAHTAHGDGREFLLVTQNVDNLHEQAGSKNVLHMHGQLLKMRCIESNRVVDWTGDCTPEVQCACCERKRTLRPDIVWFGEVPFFMDEIAEQLSECDLFVSIGTSGNVYPAAGFFQIAKRYGAHTVELNLEPSMNAALFDEGHYGSASRVVADFFDGLSHAQANGAHD